MADVLKKFGRYFLLDQIAQGGMAEIYRARLANVDGAGRLLVIKRIMAGYGENPEFLSMFKSEIKVTMGFNHPNIVQLYDFGEENKQPYIAMEFVDGKNLRQFMNRFNELKKPFPVELASFIIEQAACGLQYAHGFRDKITGQSLSIVHRDISPQNVLISYEGNVKVIDFGIAKATTNNENTRAGVIKGKPSYLSPEQISGDPLDGRCDIFALGIVLWELLVGKKLFAGENDLAVLKQIESCQTHVKPPSAYNTGVPKELDLIVLKALAKQREKRYQTAEELQRALHKFLYAYLPEFNPADLEYYSKDMFKNEIVEDRKKIQKLNDEVEKLLKASELLIPQQHRFVVDEGTGRSVETEGSDHTTTMVDPKPLSTGSREVWDSGAIKSSHLELEGGDGKTLQSGKRGPYALKNTAKVGSVRFPQSTDERAKSKGGFGKFLMYSTAATLVAAVFGPQFGMPVPVLSQMIGEMFANPRKLASVPTPGATIPYIPRKPDDTVKSNESGMKMVNLRVNIIPRPEKVKLLVNGKDVDPINPVVRVPLDSSVEVSVISFGYRAVRQDFSLDATQAAGKTEIPHDVILDKLPTGYLTVITTARATATFMINNEPVYETDTPFTKKEFPVGVYTMRVRSVSLDSDRTLHQPIVVKEGEVAHPADRDGEINLLGEK